MKSKIDQNEIHITQANEKNAELISEWLSDIDTNLFLSSNLRNNNIELPLIKVTLKRIDQSWNILNYDNIPVGLIVLDNYDKIDGLANLWYLIGDKKFRSKSIMSTGIKIFINNIPLKLDVVTAWTGSNNFASMKCLEKAGFNKIGKIRKAFKVNGVHDRVLYEKLLTETVE